MFVLVLVKIQLKLNVGLKCIKTSLKPLIIRISEKRQKVKFLKLTYLQLSV
jgi:hypothetical protein